MDTHTLSLLISGREKEISENTLATLDWDELARAAHVEGVGPLLYWQLSRSGRLSSLPEKTRDFLLLLYGGTRIQNQEMFKELESLAHAFHQGGIELVALKGICLALTVYPDVALRPIGDMDVLVPKAKLAGAVAIAKALGYQDAKPEASPGLTALLYHEICLRKPGPQPVTLELHHSLVADATFTYAVPVDWFWEQTEPLKPLSSQTAFEHLLTLTPEAQILYAAGHAMLQHGGANTPLRWYYDLDLLIRHYSHRLDWDLLLSQAKAFEWSSALDAALAQTVAYFDTPVPEWILASLSASHDRHRDLVALKQIPPATHILQERQKLLSLNIYGRLRLVLALLVPSPAYMRWRYRLESAWLLPLYYPYRWWGILKDAVRTLLSILPGYQK